MAFHASCDKMKIMTADLLPDPGLMICQLSSPAASLNFGAKIAASCASGAADDPLTTSSAKILVLSWDRPRACPRAVAVGCKDLE
jgi:hypothetical protein